MKQIVILALISSVLGMVISCGQTANTITTTSSSTSSKYAEPVSLEIYNSFLDHTYQDGDVIYLSLGINEGVSLIAQIEPSDSKKEVSWSLSSSENVDTENIQKDSITIRATKVSAASQVITATHADNIEMTKSITVYTQNQPKYISSISFSDDANNASFGQSSDTLFTVKTYTNTLLNLTNYIQHSPVDTTETKKGYTWSLISGLSITEIDSTGNVTTNNNCGVSTVNAASTRSESDTAPSSNLNIDVIARIGSFSFKDQLNTPISSIITSPSSTVIINVEPNYIPSDTSGCTQGQGFTNDSIDRSVIQSISRSGNQYTLNIKPNISTSSATITFRSTAVANVIGEPPVTTNSLNIIVFP